MSADSFNERPAADNPAQAQPQAEGASLELMSPEQINKRRKRAKEIYDAITGESEETMANLDLLVAQLKDIYEKFHEQNNLDGEYGHWFADLIRKADPAGSYDRDADLNFFRLINLSRELSQQNINCSREKAELDAIRQEISGEQRNLEAVKQKIVDEQKNLDRVRADRDAAIAAGEREKEAELAGIQKQIDGKRRELEGLNQQIGQAQAKLKSYDAPSDDDFRGFYPPDDPKSGHIYLCGSYAFIDITATPQVMRNVLQGLDPDADDDNAFRSMGQPQIVIRQLPDGRFMAKSQTNRLPNKVDGKLLSCEEETELRQGAAIEMTDKKGNTQTVKVYIAI